MFSQGNRNTATTALQLGTHTHTQSTVQRQCSVDSVLLIQSLQLLVLLFATRTMSVTVSISCSFTVRCISNGTDKRPFDLHFFYFYFLVAFALQLGQAIHTLADYRVGSLSRATHTSPLQTSRNPIPSRLLRQSLLESAEYVSPAWCPKQIACLQKSS